MNLSEKSFPQIVQKEEALEQVKTPEEIIEFRYQQSYESQLAEYITGLRPDDVKFEERFTTDQKIIREKYSLPARELKWETPTEYERFFRERAEKDGVKIRDKSDCGTFFEEYPYAGAMFFEKRNEIGITINKKSLDSYTKSLVTLEHEFIHSQQEIISPRMPIELMEYEASIAGLSPDFIRNPDSAEIFFSSFVGPSVRHWYKEKNNERNANELEIKAIYEDPEYFLKNVDHIDEEVIKAYKKKLAENVK